MQITMVIIAPFPLFVNHYFINQSIFHDFKQFFKLFTINAIFSVFLNGQHLPPECSFRCYLCVQNFSQLLKCSFFNSRNITARDADLLSNFVLAFWAISAQAIAMNNDLPFLLC